MYSLIISMLLLHYCDFVISDCMLLTKSTTGIDGIGKADQSLTESERVLKKLDPLQGKIFNVTTVHEDKDEYTYSVAICANLYGYTPATVGVVQIDELSKMRRVIGRINSTAVKGGTDWIMLTYKSGDNYGRSCQKSKRQAHIMLVCNPDDTKGTLRILYEEKSGSSEQDCFYLFELSTNTVCSNYNTGLSGGSIFLIVFFTLVGTYLLIGMAYKRYVYGSKGMEQVPNIGFWRSFGALQADGCDFLCRCNGGSNFNDNPYRGVADDQLDDERDDENLLPM